MTRLVRKFICAIFDCDETTKASTWRVFLAVPLSVLLLAAAFGLGFLPVRFLLNDLPWWLTEVPAIVAGSLTSIVWLNNLDRICQWPLIGPILRFIVDAE